MTKIESIRYIASDAAVIIDGVMWISNRNYNGLYCWKIEEKSATFMGEFPLENRNEWRLHSSAVYCDKKIFFLPDRSRYIHVYDTEQKAFDTIDLYCQERFLTRFAFLFGKQIVFALGRPKACICMMDTTDYSIQYYYNQNEKCDFSEDYIVRNNSVWFLSEGSNIINEFSLTRNEYIPHEIDDERLYTIASEDDDLVIGTLNGAIRWNSDKGILKKYDGFPDLYKFVSLVDDEIVEQDVCDVTMNGENPFSLSIANKNDVLLFPRRTNAILKVDRNKILLSEHSIANESAESLNQPFRITHSRFVSVCRNEKVVVLFSSIDRSFYFYNLASGSYDKKRVFATEPFDLGKYLFDTENDFFYEDELFYKLSDYIKIV